MRLKEGIKSSFLFLFLFLLLSSYTAAQEQKGRFNLYSLRNKDEGSIIMPPVVKKPEAVLRSEVEHKKPKPKPRPKPKPKPKPEPKLSPPEPKERIEPKPLSKEVVMPLSIIEEPKTKGSFLLSFGGLIISGLVTLILIFLIVIHLAKREESYQKRRRLVAAKDTSKIEEGIEGLWATSKGLEREITEIEKRIPKDLFDDLKSGKVVEAIGKEVRKAIEPRIRELAIAYQGIKKSLAELDREVVALESLKNLNFKELARQTATEFWRPLQNEFSKTRLFYEKILGELEERQEGRTASLEKKYDEIESAIAEMNKRLVAIDSVVTSATVFEGEPILRTQKPKEKQELSDQKKEDRTVLNRYIYKLADQGLTVDDIAQKTKLGKGEIRLILDLRKMR